MSTTSDARYLVRSGVQGLIVWAVLGVLSGLAEDLAFVVTAYNVAIVSWCVGLPSALIFVWGADAILFGRE